AARRPERDDDERFLGGREQPRERLSDLLLLAHHHALLIEPRATTAPWLLRPQDNQSRPATPADRSQGASNDGRAALKPRRSGRSRASVALPSPLRPQRLHLLRQHVADILDLAPGDAPAEQGKD